MGSTHDKVWTFGLIFLCVLFLCLAYLFVNASRKRMSNIAYFKLLRQRRLDRIASKVANVDHGRGCAVDTLAMLLPPGDWMGFHQEIDRRRARAAVYDLAFEVTEKLSGSCSDQDGRVTGGFSLSRGDAEWGVECSWGGVEAVAGLERNSMTVDSKHALPVTIRGHFVTSFGTQGVLELRHSTVRMETEMLDAGCLSSADICDEMAKGTPVFRRPSCLDRTLACCAALWIYRMSSSSLLSVSNLRKSKRPTLKLEPLQPKPYSGNPSSSSATPHPVKLGHDVDQESEAESDDEDEVNESYEEYLRCLARHSSLAPISSGESSQASTTCSTNLKSKPRLKTNASRPNGTRPRVKRGSADSKPSRVKSDNADSKSSSPVAVRTKSVKGRLDSISSDPVQISSPASSPVDLQIDLERTSILSVPVLTSSPASSPADS